jgi:transcriptional regulator with XRE-family HTH domain
MSPKTLDRLVKYLDVDDLQDITLKNVGAKIRVLRQVKNLTLEQLGELTGISLSYLSEIEREKRIPPFSTLRRIADVLETPISLFINNERKMSIVGEKLKKTRLHHGLTQVELADMAGVSPGLIAQIESGTVQASLDTLTRLSQVLGVSVCYLILEQEEVEEIIGAITPEMRELLYDPKVQMIIGSICSMAKEEIILVLNFINMLKKPAIPLDRES